MKNYLLVIILFLNITNCSNTKEETIIGEWKFVNRSNYIIQDHAYVLTSDSTYQLINDSEDGDMPLPFSVVGDSIIFERGAHYISIVGRDNIYFKQKYYFQKENNQVFLVIGDDKYKRKE